MPSPANQTSPNQTLPKQASANQTLPNQASANQASANQASANQYDRPATAYPSAKAYPSARAYPGASGYPAAEASTAETIESFDYRVRTVANPSAMPEADSLPALTQEDALERAAAQLASVFPGFLSIARPTASPSGGPGGCAASAGSAGQAGYAGQAGNTGQAGYAEQSGLGGPGGHAEAVDAASDQMPAEATELWQQGWQAGLAQGREEGMLAARDAFATAQREDANAALAAIRQQVLQTIQEFSVERERYFHELEQEAVRLALAIAARILRREAQMDPLLLSGAVRVALGQLGESTTVRLLVPEADRSLWEESLRLTPGLRLRPEVVGDARMELGECRIQTDFGGADLSLHEQLREIERGFFDRLPQRAVAGPSVAEPSVARPSAPQEAVRAITRPAEEEMAGGGRMPVAGIATNSATNSSTDAATNPATSAASYATQNATLNAAPSAAVQTASETGSSLAELAGVPR